MKDVFVVIIGGGPRGLSVLERIVAFVSSQPERERYTINLVDPGHPGQGVHRASQPHHLITNTAAAQTTVFLDGSVRDAGVRRMPRRRPAHQHESQTDEFRRNRLAGVEKPEIKQALRRVAMQKSRNASRMFLVDNDLSKNPPKSSSKTS